ncbi:hypothetical protein OS493_017043 [Desmophyllum pertusum]|uniref:Cytochrome P450 n=1 Tax=Desmophyllum pertusum TaxID=174260 RepID=A0A9X0CG95_9CNID|nr:hypothetical protein OS493_017043 [Desmophyllum pertusum]
MTSLPGRVGWPVTGDKTLEFARNPIEFTQKNIKTCNSRVFQLRTLNKPHVFVASNQGVKEILEDKGAVLDMGYKDFGYMYSLFGDVVLFNSDDEAVRLRNVLHYIFRPEEVTRYMGDVETVSSKLLNSIEDNDIVIPYTLFKQLTTEMCLRLFLGLEMETAKEEAASIVELTIAHWHGLISVPVNFNVYGYKSGYGKAMVAKTRLLTIVNKRLSEEKNGFLNVIKESDFKSKAEMANHILLFASALVPKALSSLMTSFCIELAKPQNLEKRLKAAQDDRYLENVLLEVKRLWPPFLGGRRLATQEMIIDGYIVPAGHYVGFLTRAANCDPKIFPEAEKFLPERWDTCNQLDRDRVWTFGSGPRMCVGHKFIHKIIKLLAKQLLQSYEWELVPGQDLTYKWLPVSRPKNDIQVVFTKIGL